MWIFISYYTKHCRAVEIWGFRLQNLHYYTQLHLEHKFLKIFMLCIGIKGSFLVQKTWEVKRDGINPKHWNQNSTYNNCLNFPITELSCNIYQYTEIKLFFS